MAEPENLTEAQPTDETAARPMAPSWGGRVLRLAVLLVAVGTAGGLAAYWLLNPPTAERRRPPKRALAVEGVRVETGSHRVVVEAMGAVEPARQVPIAARVGGEVTRVSERFVPGGRFAAGEVLLEIDPEDYEIAVRKAEIARAQARLAVRQREAEITARQSERAKAREALKVEQGAAAVAQREYDLLGETVEEGDRELVLRQPQLASTKAAAAAAEAAVEAARAAKASAEQAVENAEATLRQARLDLARTTVRAPFAGAIVSRSVETGAQVAPRQTLAEYVGTERYWVRAHVGLGELRHIQIPGFNSDTGSPVRVRHRVAWAKGAYRRGTVVGLRTGLEERGRMAQVLVAVDDPLELARPPAERRPLVLDSYVRAEILGRELPGATRVPRAALREGTQVWVLVPDPDAGGEAEPPQDDDQRDATSSADGGPAAGPPNRPATGRERASRAAREGAAAGNGDRADTAPGANDIKGTLDIRNVEIAWSTADAVYVSTGLDAGDLLVTSDIGAPVEGMALRTTTAPGAPGPVPPGQDAPDTHGQGARDTHGRDARGAPEPAATEARP